jgi:hypothetical protein
VSLAVAAVLTAGALAGPAPAGAISAPGSGPFGLTPAPTTAGLPRPYFELTIAPGRSARDTVIISNEGTRTDHLRVATSSGITAANSGSAFGQPSGKCTGPGCWVSGLPAIVTLAPGARMTLEFRVAVPATTGPGQYLAGITAEPATRSPAVPVGSGGRASAKAVIIDQVTVGVAVTVGRLAHLRTALVISAVRAGSVGSLPRLYIPVRNSGQTFTRATGSVACRTHGWSRSYRVVMDTVLPGDSAVIPVNAPGLPSGPVPCTARLLDAAGHAIAWTGTVDVPDPKPTVTIHTGDGVYSALPADRVPPWAIALMVLGALILLALGGLLIVRWKR